jgi:hypothetical protein
MQKLFKMADSLERILINAYKQEMVYYLGSHPEDYNQVILLALGDKQPFCWRAAWLLWSCMEKNDSRIVPYIDNIIAAVSTKRGGHQRELLKILLQMETSEQQDGLLFDISITLWENISQPPSVRHVAFRMILKIAKRYPELLNEIIFFCQEHYLDSLSPGIKNSVKRMIANLKK